MLSLGHDCCMHELRAVMVTCTRLIQSKFQHRWESNSGPPQTRELVAVYSSWEKEKHSSLWVWPWQDAHAPADGPMPMHMWELLDGLSYD